MQSIRQPGGPPTAALLWWFRDSFLISMLTHADVRHLILTHKWIPDGHAFTVEYVQTKINEVALQKGLMKPKQQHETTTEVDRLFPAVIWELLLREIFVPG